MGSFETERLELLPLTPAELEMWIEDLPKLEKALGSLSRAEPPEGFFPDILKSQLAIT